MANVQSKWQTVSLRFCIPLAWVCTEAMEESYGKDIIASGMTNVLKGWNAFKTLEEGSTSKSKGVARQTQAYNIFH